VINVFDGWLPQSLIDAIASLSFLTHFSSIAKGVIDLRDLLYFATLIAVWLAANAIVLDMKKAD
jgi:ABC-2 type transport system permease protein